MTYLLRMRVRCGHTPAFEALESQALTLVQCNALQVGDQLLLHFVRVLDQTKLRRDDEEPGTGKKSSRAETDSRQPTRKRQPLAVAARSW